LNSIRNHHSEAVVAGMAEIAIAAVAAAVAAADYRMRPTLQILGLFLVIYGHFLFNTYLQMIRLEHDKWNLNRNH
jgi:RsiW-degrading membrane proteinase PrsW (M82 family)